MIKYLRIFLDLFFTTLIFAVIFLISYKIASFITETTALKWYVYLLIGFLQTVFFRLFGVLLGPKDVRRVLKN
jgi:hypothetical protein